MSLPVIVDIAIGLVFIYLLLSLLASEIQELIATILQWRAKHLKDSITNLFASDTQSHHSVEQAHQLAKQIYQHPLIRGINQESKGFLPNLFRGITWILSCLYRWIAGKSEGEFGDRRTAPSYIPREAFATALLEQLGTKYFVERLIEAKFSEFVDVILDRVGADETIQNQTGYQKLYKNLWSIEQEFINNRIDLNSAVQGIDGKLNVFLEDVEDTMATDDLEELKDWKSRVFIINDLERVIKNAGLNPTLQEIVDSIDKSSKTYRTYKDRFRRYEQERFQEVRRDLRYFEEFLLVFLRGLLSEEAPATNHMPSLAATRAKILTDLEKLDDLFFKDSSSDSSELQHSDRIQRTKTPMTQIGKVIIDNLAQLEKTLDPKFKNGTTQRLRHSIHAFREGFEGRNYLSDWRDFRLFQEVISSQIVPFFLFFSLGILIAVGLSDIALPETAAMIGEGEQRAIIFRNLLIGRWGGLVAVVCLAGVPFLWFVCSRAYFARRPRSKDVGRQSPNPAVALQAKTLAEIFDDYSADELPRVLQAATSAQTGTARERSKQAFSTAIAKRLESIAAASDAALYNEVKDLGRSFRRYYLRLILENADVDLPFIPNSIKQSLAVLIRRSKISAKQAEDQIIYLKAEVEDWYDRSMERASGVYRRNAKGISILIGITLAIAVNANSIHILDQLAFDNELRQTMVGSIQQTAENTDTSDTEELLDTLQETLDEINLPIGWDPYLIDEEFNCNLPRDTSAGEGDPRLWHQLIQVCLYGQEGIVNETANPSESPEAFFYPTAIASIFLQQPLVGLRYLLGWIITGIAISMGASFWFDLLGKLVNVRNTGPLQTSPTTATPQETTATASKAD
ncbi:MAG: hypothetical protein AAGE59_15145 [Cyanobacteria bacterium P01_F01_bin.86]